VSSCGSILSANAANDSLYDLLAGEDLAFEPYRLFRCSADRKTIVGTAISRSGDLMLGVPPREKIAGPSDFERDGFSISGDGSKVAYSKRRLCLFLVSAGAECVESQSSLIGAPSVNDSGEVLLTIGTGHECFYKTPSNFSPTRFSGATDENRDECLGIGYWRPGKKEVEIIEPLGRDPQWISQATAGSLQQWSSHPDGARQK
jgi:hypothetical protein